MPPTPTNRNTYSKSVLYMVRHFHAAKQSIKAMIKNPFSGIMTILIIGISGALPALLFVLLESIQNVSSHWGGKPSLTVYLKPTASDTEISTLLHLLQQQPNVKDVSYISPAQGLQELKQNSHIQDMLNLLKNNPLPPVIVISLSEIKHGAQSIAPLIDKLQHSTLVDQTNIDTTWIERINYILASAKRITLVLALILGAGLTLIVSNTIRLNTQAHYHDIQVLKFIGATTTYIRRPYLYHGLFYGGLGGLLAWSLVFSALLWISPPAQQLFASYQIAFSMTGNTLVVGIILIFISSALSITGAWIAVNHQLSLSSS